jgi:hypothetical protein
MRNVVPRGQLLGRLDGRGYWLLSRLNGRPDAERSDCGVDVLTRAAEVPPTTVRAAMTIDSYVIRSLS